jgi:hypothetical protein
MSATSLLCGPAMLEWRSSPAMDSPDITGHDLRLLSIGYYIQAGIAAFYSILLLGYAGFATAMLGSLANSANEAGQNIPPWFLSLISILMLVVLLLACLYTVALFLAGLWLRRFRNILFIQVIAALNCLAIPYGTVLGIFTFLVLQRSTAKQFFLPRPAPVPADPPAAS